MGEASVKRTAVEWAKDEWGTPVLILGTAVSTIAQAFENKPLVWMLIIGASLGVIGGVRSLWQSHRLSEYRGKIRTAEDARDAVAAELASGQDDLAALSQVSRSVYRSLLYQMAKELGLGTQERITLYGHDEKLPSFQKWCRHSDNAALENATGRPAYPDDIGVIGKAWREGYAEERDLSDPNVADGKYAAENFQKYDLPTAVTDGLAMKSRVLVAIRYPASQGSEPPIGVIVVESLDDGWDLSDVRSTLNKSDWWYTLQEHLRAQRRHLPVLSNALAKGF